MNGLTSQKVKEIQLKEGLNTIPEKRVTLLQKVFKNIINPITLMLVAASILSFFLGKTFDGYFIIVLIFLNVGITIWQEGKADEAVRKLNAKLEVFSQVFRDGKWQEVNSKNLVPGDYVSLKIGDLVPADGVLDEVNNLSLNEASMTGESLPRQRLAGEQIFSGTIIATGTAKFTVTAIGIRTYLGKTLNKIDTKKGQSVLEKDIFSVSRFLTTVAIICILVLNFFLIFKNAPILENLNLSLSLLIASVPVSLPTVMTIIIEIGALFLAKKEVIIRRLSALEDLSNVNLLLTDKTGTLTENQIHVDSINCFDNFSNDDVLIYAHALAATEEKDPINHAILEKEIKSEEIKVENFTPADSIRKRITANIDFKNNKLVVSSGAPQLIKKLSKLNDAEKRKYDHIVQTLAEKGQRSIAVAIGKEEKDMEIVGIIGLSDTIRSDAKDVIQFLDQNHVDVTMLTGDSEEIAGEVAKQIGIMGEKVIAKDHLEEEFKIEDGKIFKNTKAFAGILPEDKLNLVRKAKENYIVAVTGDGVNDIPAVKEANVGIAVANAVSALKSSADIVLLANGISVIKDAIIEGRKIFQRIYSYSVYRISESFRLLISITILGIIAGSFPLTSLQIILLAFLNDIPIISLAFDKVESTANPGKINVKQRFTLSTLFGFVGVANSLLLYFLMFEIWHLPLEMAQTMFFLKFTVSGHLLIFVARTKKKWWQSMPAKEVITATLLTQLLATLLAYTGILMPGKVPLDYIAFVWLWAFFWMQVGELTKWVQNRFLMN